MNPFIIDSLWPPKQGKNSQEKEKVCGQFPPRNRPQTRITATKKPPAFRLMALVRVARVRTHGLLNPILCDEWYGRTHRQKSAETSHFQGFLFPRFWYETGSFITHSLRPPDGEILQAHFGTATKLFPVWAKERCGLENRRSEPSPPSKTDVPL